jgi:hypothetical protein
MILLPPDKYYPYDEKIEDRYYYSFKTNFEVVYEIVFKPSPYVFGEEKEYAHLLYEFSVLASFAGPQSYVRDDLIAETIVAIFIDFYNRFDENVCFYICDSSDGKQFVRKRKFDSWFVEYNKGAFMKFDSLLKDTDGVEYPVAIILTKANKYLKEISQAFGQLISGINEGK